jgi:Tol biopolymer transport system component
MTVDGGERIAVPSYSPDGSEVIFTRSRGDQNGLWKVDSKTQHADLLLPLEEDQNVGGAVFSPDGKKIALHLANGDVFSLYMLNANDAGLTLLLDK